MRLQNNSMATFQYSLLYSSLLVALLFSCFSQKTDACFHTTSLNDLLPSSFCDTPSTADSSKRQPALEVVHRHGPCLSYKNKAKAKAKAKHTPIRRTLSRILAQDQSRVEAIQARLNPNLNQLKGSKTLYNHTKANLSVYSGLLFQTLEYIVHILLGTPKKPLSLIFDTGSSLTWTQCRPCAPHCYNQSDPIFNPSVSTSYSNISCNSPECSQLVNTTGHNHSCSGNTCLYSTGYGDGSDSMGFLSKDTLTITPHDVFPNYTFGCGHITHGDFGLTAGVLGLGRDQLSFVSQTATAYGKYFSYCLPSVQGKGFLKFGKSPNATNEVKFTNFTGSGDPNFYVVSITSIKVGNSEVLINQSVSRAPGTIIDSGTVITRLPPKAYRQMRNAFRSQMTNYKQTEPHALLDTCYDFGNSTSITIPSVSFTFGGDAVLELAPINVLYPMNSTTFCLAFAGNSKDEDYGIFGSTQQKRLEVVYDVAGGKLGFGADGCN